MRIRLVIGTVIVLAAITLSLGEAPVGPAITHQERLKDGGRTAGSTDFELSWHTIDGGGVMHSSGGKLELSGSIGQPDAGRMSSADGVVELTGGFWFEVLLSDCNEDGTVNLSDYDSFQTCLSGPGGGALPPACNCHDFNGDSMVSMFDFATMQIMFNGQ